MTEPRAQVDDIRRAHKSEFWCVGLDHPVIMSSEQVAVVMLDHAGVGVAEEDEGMVDQELTYDDDEEAYAAATCDGFGHDSDEGRSKQTAET